MKYYLITFKASTSNYIYLVSSFVKSRLDISKQNTHTLIGIAIIVENK